jgi:mono/diheme cytochrome c family protein
MRHFLANVATYTIAALLIGGAALFAWMRSAQVALTDERTVLARYEPAPAHEFRWRELGGSSYVRNCMNCHGREGEGWDQYPGLGHTAELFTAPGGREYVAELHLYGLASRRWRAPMPPMGHIHDAEMAAVINHVLTSFGNERRVQGIPLYAPADIAARRGQRLSPRQVDQRRPAPFR